MQMRVPLIQTGATLVKPGKRVIPFNAHAYAHTWLKDADWPCHVKLYCVGCRQYVDASTEQNSECMGEGSEA